MRKIDDIKGETFNINGGQNGDSSGEKHYHRINGWDRRL